MRVYAFQNETKAYLNRLERENGIRVSGVLAKSLNDRVESLKKSGIWASYSLGFNDTDGDAYLSRAGVTDIIGRSEVLWFIRGMKALGLYSNMVAWPMRSYQNIGTGSTVYSLGGLGVYNGTMVNSPTWGVDGITFGVNGTACFTTTLSVMAPNRCLLAAGRACFDTQGSAYAIDADAGAANYNGLGMGMAAYTARQIFNSVGNSTVAATTDNAWCSLCSNNEVNSSTVYLNASSPDVRNAITYPTTGSVWVGRISVLNDRGWTRPLSFAAVLNNSISASSISKVHQLLKNTTAKELP